MDVLYALQSLPAPFQNPHYGKLPRQGLVPDGKVSATSKLRCNAPEECRSALAAGRLGPVAGGRPEGHGRVGMVPSTNTTSSQRVHGFSRHRLRRLHVAGDTVQGLTWVLKAIKGIEYALQSTGGGFSPVFHAKRTHRE